MSARHAEDQELCRAQPGIVTGKLCDACEGRCPICDSRSNPTRQVKVCDSCAGAERYAFLDSNNNFRPAVAAGGGGEGAVSQQQDQPQQQVAVRCIICNNVARHVAYYCHACVLLEKDRDGCPKVRVTGMKKLSSVFRRK